MTVVENFIAVVKFLKLMEGLHIHHNVWMNISSSVYDATCGILLAQGVT